jgi:hypothetical protein
MQTFLPFSDFSSVSLLDSKRLHNQFNEFLVIRKAALKQIKAWQNHPAVVMWRNHEVALSSYGLAVYKEIEKRGLVVPSKIYLEEILSDLKGTLKLPGWIGNEEFHKAHRKNLIRKDAKFYSSHFKETSGDIYVWPIQVSGNWIYRKKQVGAKKYLEGNLK